MELIKLREKSMFRKNLALVLVFFMALSVMVFAQNEDMRLTVDHRINKMKTALKLTETQINAIKPIVQEYLVKRSEILAETAGQGIIDHVAIKTTLKRLKEGEYRQLARILSEDQMKKWINKENLMASLNPDGEESMVDDGPTLGADGANFKF